jgi:hypothetical protein
LRNTEPIIGLGSCICARDKLKDAEDAAIYARNDYMNAFRFFSSSFKYIGTPDWSARSAAFSAAWASNMADSISAEVSYTGYTAHYAARYAAMAAALALSVSSRFTKTRKALQASALELLERMKKTGEHIPASDMLFMNCSIEESVEISEDEKKAFLESMELCDFLPSDGLEAKITTKKTRL